MRREIIQNVLIILFFVACGIGWWTEYVMPRHRVEMAAHTCMAEQGISPCHYEGTAAKWNICAQQASKDHGSRLLRVMGL